MIDPGTKRNGEEYMAYNRRRWGGDGWTYSLRKEGQKSGANFANWKWWPNTFHAHRLCRYAINYGKEDEVMSTLFRYLYEEGKNISDIDVLAAAGDECGLPDAHKILISNDFIEEVETLDTKAKRRGVDGVPFFDIHNEQGEHERCSGAQSSDYFLSVIAALAGS
eukprot:TRINITY_DN18184_c0_g1_i1.p1 TRINITY_DN18184_c0_g1~~TRINITY_DN18184_c0_g1_i1.p1  ORF type:complete len:165 (-),score=45.68 TRINITY_DN18184_c0_g1_i1:237-731(-)